MSEAHHEIASDPTLEGALGREQTSRRERERERRGTTWREIHTYRSSCCCCCRLFINRAKSLSPGYFFLACLFLSLSLIIILRYVCKGSTLRSFVAMVVVVVLHLPPWERRRRRLGGGTTPYTIRHMHRSPADCSDVLVAHTYFFNLKLTFSSTSSSSFRRLVVT